MNKIFLISVLALLFACTNGKSNGDFIPEDTFVDVLVDIHMADGVLAVKGYNINRDSTKIELLYQDIMVKHNISTIAFKNTVESYTKRPKDFENVYEKVSEKLSKIESEFEESAKKEREAVKQMKKSK